MKILVAGAGGFIGGHLIGRLLAQGHTVRAADWKGFDDWWQPDGRCENIRIDLREKSACEAVVQGVDRVFNLACDMGGMGFIESNKALCMLSVMINTHLLSAAQKFGVQRYFFASSACVYNADKQRSPHVIPLKEQDAYPAMPEDGYGWEKLFSERMCRHFTEDFGVATRVARFHNVYGPQGTWTGGREKVPAAICRKVIHAKLTGDLDLEIWGTGEQTRSFTFIDDCIHGVELLMDSDVAEPLNIGSAELVSINGLVSMIEEFAGIKLKRRYKLDAPKGVNGRNSDNTKIQALLKWAPSTRLTDGLAKTYAWIYDQVANNRKCPIY